jgi:hypothetical protein
VIYKLQLLIRLTEGVRQTISDVLAVTMVQVSELTVTVAVLENPDPATVSRDPPVYKNIHQTYFNHLKILHQFAVLGTFNIEYSLYHVFLY